MTIGLKAFRDIQISNAEGTPRIAEAATDILLGTITPNYADKAIHYPEHERNTTARNMGDDFVVSREAELTFEGEMNMRHIVWMLSNSVKGKNNPTQPDSGNEPNAYLWNIYAVPASATTPEIGGYGIDTFTIEYGDNVQHYEAAGCFTRTIEISGAPNEPVMVSWEITGDKVTESTKTAALSVIDTQYFPSNLVELYIDSSWANMGNTQKTDALKAWTWRLETQFTPRYTASGSMSHTGVNEDRKAAQLEMTLLRDSALSEIEKNDYDNRTTTYIRIACKGATELDSGQGNVPYVYLQGSYRYTDWDTDDEDGMVVANVTAESVLDSVGSQHFSTLVYTNLSAFP